MKETTVRLYSKDSNLSGLDISELIENIQYETSLYGYAGKLTLQVKRDLANLFSVSNGNLIEFVHDDFNIFRGYVFSFQVKSDGSYTIVAYDQLRYFQNHDSFYTDGSESASDIFQKICITNKINFSVKTKTMAKISPYHFNDVSYFDIMLHAIDETHRANVVHDYFPEKLTIGIKVQFSGGANYLEPNETVAMSTNRTPGTAIITMIKNNSLHPYHIVGVNSNVYGWVDVDSITIIPQIKFNSDEHYFIRDNFGTLEFLSLTNMLKTTTSDGVENTLIIGDGSLMTDFTYDESIDKETVNDVIVISETSKKDSKGTDSDNIKHEEVSATTEKWGVLRKIVKVRSDASMDKIQNYARLILDVYDKPTKTLKLNCIGQDGFCAGNAFFLFISNLNLALYVYITSAVHTYDGKNHTMELEVTTSGFPEGIN